MILPDLDRYNLAAPYDKNSIKFLGQWFYFWSQTKILFVKSKPVGMSNDYDSSNLD